MAVQAKNGWSNPSGLRRTNKAVWIGLKIQSDQVDSSRIFPLHIDRVWMAWSRSSENTWDLLRHDIMVQMFLPWLRCNYCTVKARTSNRSVTVYSISLIRRKERNWFDEKQFDIYKVLMSAMNRDKRPGTWNKHKEWMYQAETWDGEGRRIVCRECASKSRQDRR
jgi:hypothetical protein